VPLSTLPKLRIASLLNNICSVTVVFPASTWARIPMFLIFKLTAALLSAKKDYMLKARLFPDGPLGLAHSKINF
jgi:hypothetical protein